jgi:hypothetical protein
MSAATPTPHCSWPPGYTIKELMEFMGHADLQMVNRCVKLLPQPGEDDAADRLNAYLRRATHEPNGPS